ncbi:MAG TPA: hypothetical protein IAB51_06045 [Candidatus Merdivicinus excrementipullorum]|uniref:Uncharacterized protein n=1 Tax=Candidatus Merdivicinus excrementipullorum TaxID=2840867 RepID=A0A9D1FND6_9FIRM|nr:hypothetical protein [Candidatus Merdivicinus excrementipullorum]
MLRINLLYTVFKKNTRGKPPVQPGTLRRRFKRPKPDRLPMMKPGRRLLGEGEGAENPGTGHLAKIVGGGYLFNESLGCRPSFLGGVAFFFACKTSPFAYEIVRFPILYENPPVSLKNSRFYGMMKE